MRDSRRLPRMCRALIVCATFAVWGCSEQSRAGGDPIATEGTGAVSAQATAPSSESPSDPEAGGSATAPAGRGADTAGSESEPAGPPPESDCVSVPVSAYPTDAPYYPAATTLTTCRSSDGRIEQVSTAPNSGEVIYAHMTRSLEVQGWAIQSKMAQNGQFLLDATKANRRAAVMIADREIVESKQATRITVLVTP